MVEFQRNRCLRLDYANNECDLCAKCYPEAIDFTHGIAVDTKPLGDDVIGACPAQAFESDQYDPHLFVLKFIAGSTDTLQAGDIVPLEALSVEHFLTIALRKENVSVVSDNAHVTARVHEANERLRRLGFTRRLTIQEHSQSNRRGFFKRVADTIKQKDLELTGVYDYHSRIPVARQMLQNALKLHVGKMEKTTPQTQLYAPKTIDFAACDNCGDCIQFCPTKALFHDREHESIYFQSGSCIACNICSDICHSDAIGKQSDSDLVAFAFDKPNRLITHEMVRCTQCKTPFARKDGSTTCHVCQQMEQSDLFTIAADM